MNGKLIQVSEPELRAQLLQLAGAIVDQSPDRLSPHWLRNRALTAVPAEFVVPGRVMAPLQRIWRAYAEYACARLYVVVLGVEPGDPRELYVVGDTMEDLARCCYEVSWANRLLTTMSGTYLILSTTGEHCVVAGPEAFVKQVLRCKPTTAYRRWCEFAEHFAGRDEYKYYMDVTKHYEEFVQSPGPGAA